MAKRTRDDVDVLHPTQHPLRGLGQSKRVKRKIADAAANKENLACSRQIEQSKSTQNSTQQPGCPSRTRGIKNTKPVLSTVLQPKPSNTTKLLMRHPVSEHITTSNLYSEENWIGRQQHLFTLILNEVLESRCSRSNLWDDEMTKRNRKTAFGYYQSQAFQLIVRRLNSVLNLSLEANPQGLSQQTTCTYTT